MLGRIWAHLPGAIHAIGDRRWRGTIRAARTLSPWRGAVCTVALLGLLAACSTPQRGGYYQDDGPERVPADLANVPDATPRIEPFAPANLRPYTISGRRYTPMADNRGFRQEGLASWYGRKFHGKRTANGEIYNMYAMTAAHPTLPIPSYARVTHKATGQSVIVRVNDRGPFHSNRVIDLSYAAAAQIGLLAPGTGPVIVEAISHDEIRAGTYAAPTQTAAAQTTQTAQTPQAIPIPPTVQTPPPGVPSPPPVAQAAPTPPTAARTPPQTSRSRQIFLQFGAFSVVDNAYRLASGLSTVVPQAVLVPLGEDGLHRVLIGPFPSRAAAAQAAEEITGITGLPSAIALH